MEQFIYGTIEEAVRMMAGMFRNGYFVNSDITKMHYDVTNKRMVLYLDMSIERSVKAVRFINNG